ncbi:MAG: toll/interleukin-1 receptor domain-containing protein [Methylovulum sp.]|nr:toll/interleukin-1 receptor domain-containing protein [Methylovulum sp.]
MIFALPDSKGRVFAREVFSENVIELRAAGHKREDILGEIIRTMDDINRDGKYDNLKVEKLLPCPCHECLKAEEPGFHDYEALYKRIEKNKPTSECKKSGEDVLISDIFGKSGVKRPALRNKNEFYKGSRETMNTPLKIFISYSHAQREYFPLFKTDFIEHAQFPNMAIEVFGDDGLPLGSAWDEYLQNQVAHCDVMLLLVSQNFMNSKYIQEKEFGAAIEQLKAGRNLLIVPIYFAPCLFNSNEELAKLQFFKPHGDDFDKAQKGDSFSYIDLIKFRETDGQPLPNANRQHYMMALMAKLTPELKKLRP